MSTLDALRQVPQIPQPRCLRCKHRHRPDLPCWKGTYRDGLTAMVLDQSRTCWICRGTASTADHIIPRAHGGGDEPENLRPACQRCNAARGTSPNPFPAEEPTPPAGVPLSPRWRRDER